MFTRYRIESGARAFMIPLLSTRIGIPMCISLVAMWYGRIIVAAQGPRYMWVASWPQLAEATPTDEYISTQ